MYHIFLPHPTQDETLDALLVRHAGVEARLARVEDKAAEFRKSRRKIQERIYYCRAIIAPIRRVPLEVLAHIFGFLVPLAPDAVSRVGQVCRTWRQASMFPELWSNVVVTAEDRAAVQKTLLYVQRSRHVSLTVTFVQSTPRNWPWSAWNTVKTSAHRWSSLSLVFDDCMIAAQEIRALPASPVLTELSVAVRRQSSNGPLHDGRFGFESGSAGFSDILSGSPLLRNLSLSTFILPVPGPLFLRLTTLHITDTYSQLERPVKWVVPIGAADLLNLLIHCHNLEDFAFDAEATVTQFVSMPPWPDVSGWPVSLPRLRRLSLNCHYISAGHILRRLRAGGLEATSLRMRPRHDTAQDKRLEMAVLNFLQDCPRLRSLHILAYSGLGTVAALVKNLRELETLHLEYPPDPDVIIRTLIKEERFCYFEKPTWLAPRLSKVIIDAQPYQLLHDNLAMFVKSRYCHNFLHGTPSCIETLLVNNRNMLEGVAPGEITAFERRERFGGRTWQMYQSHSDAT